MTDSSAVARDSRQAVVVTDGVVCLELAATEFVFPISPRGSEIKIHARMSPYRPEAAMEERQAAIGERQRKCSQEAIEWECRFRLAQDVCSLLHDAGAGAFA